MAADLVVAEAGSVMCSAVPSADVVVAVAGSVMCLVVRSAGVVVAHSAVGREVAAARWAAAS